MKALKTAAAAVALFALVGCGNSMSRVYRVAYDDTPLQNLPATCYQNSTVPTQKTELNAERQEIDFVIWDGADGKQFLDISDKSWNLGDAEPVVIAGLIESTDPKVFSGSRTRRTLPSPGSGFSDTQVSTVTVAFDEIGNTAKGSITLKSDYNCTSCNNNNNKIATCSVAYQFVGRKIDYSNIAVVNAN